MVYLDHHASHPLLPSVRQTLAQALDLVGNPSSVHLYGQRVRAKIEDVREKLASWVGLPDERVIFTSGATEANNLALFRHQGTVLCSAIEHPAVLQCVPTENHLTVTPKGVVDLDALAKRLATLSSDDQPLVSVMLANNETGIIQPISQIATLVHQRGGLLHVDAVQALGRLEVDMRVQGIDLLSISGHKIGAPAGIGALIAPFVVPIGTQIYGGGQERGLRGGTENLLGIMGLGAAISWHQEHQDHYRAHLQKLDHALETGLVDSGVQIIGQDCDKLLGCALLLYPHADAQTLLMQMDMAGIAVSSGSACSSGTVADSHVLRAMGVATDLRGSAVRISFGDSSTLEDVHAFVSAYRQSIGV